MQYIANWPFASIPFSSSACESTVQVGELLTQNTLRNVFKFLKLNLLQKCIGILCFTELIILMCLLLMFSLYNVYSVYMGCRDLNLSTILFELIISFQTVEESSQCINQLEAEIDYGSRDAVNSDSKAVVGCIKCWKDANYDQVSGFIWQHTIVK